MRMVLAMKDAQCGGSWRWGMLHTEGPGNGGRFMWSSPGCGGSSMRIVPELAEGMLHAEGPGCGVWSRNRALSPAQQISRSL